MSYHDPFHKPSDEELQAAFRAWERDHFLFLVLPIAVLLILGVLALIGWGVYEVAA